MNFLPFVFTNPLVLAGLVALPAIWWLLRMTPPRPVTEAFPPLRILASVIRREETPSKSPWWLTLLRMLMAAALIVALADPVVNPRANSLSSDGPLALVIDNGWATAGDWTRRVETAEALVADAEARDVPVSVVFTAEREQNAVPGTAAEARTRLAAARPQPLPTDRARALDVLSSALAGTPLGTLAFLTDGLAENDTRVTSAIVALQPANTRIISGEASRLVALTRADNDADAMRITATRLASPEPRSVAISALDSRGRAIANGTVDFAAGAATGSGTLAAPFELRNDFARIALAEPDNAGGVLLLDDGFRRRRVALLSGEARDQSQPLLSPLYYINRALAPYADLIQPSEPDLSVAVPELLAQKPSMLIMADIGRLPDETTGAVLQWLRNGGTLVRFAGPRLAAAPSGDPLVPVTLRQGERALGGALSWSQPQPLADYPAGSPFAGLRRPDAVTVNRQVLAEPTADLASRTWASLADGTPLVTTRAEGAGRIVLFHVSAEATWSNLPISGDFVEMLRRVVQLSRSGGVGEAGGGKPQALPPYRLLNAEGVLVSETGRARPLELTGASLPSAEFDHPPGLYGSEEGFVAVNLLPREAVLAPVDLSGLSVPHVSERLIGAESWSLKPALLTLAMLLLLLDTLIVLFMGGALSRLRGQRAATALALAGLAVLLALPLRPAEASDVQPGDEQLLQVLDKTHLAYVVTGEGEVDRLSERGLAGLTEFLTYRTTLEPGPPVGLDISKDELSVYSMIYWPISATAPMPSPQAISRIDAYMRSGGTVLFDTRDQFSALGGEQGASANGERLRAILTGLDIPPLEPVPADNVLTKSFYLLSNFPGRYTGSPLWIEAQPRGEGEETGRPARSGDGVTPIMITGNDFAGAWAIDPNGQPLLPTVPPDEMQREYAYRAGVNIMMYMLTGNYKADQVHIPALLERLGQ